MLGKISERNFVITCWAIGMLFDVLSIILFIYNIVDQQDIFPILVVSNAFLFIAIFIGARGRYLDMKRRFDEIMEENPIQR